MAYGPTSHLFFGGRKGAMVLGRGAVLALFWVVGWRGKKYLREAGGENQLWDRFHFWASLWASLSSEFRDYFRHQDDIQSLSNTFFLGQIFIVKHILFLVSVFMS